MKTPVSKAGVVLTRSRPEGTEVVLVKNRRGHWSLPKGKLRARESANQAALRELHEETSLEPCWLHDDPPVVLRKKGMTLFIWFGQAVDPEARPRGKTPEILEARWMRVQEAQEVLPGWQKRVLDSYSFMFEAHAC